MALASILTFVFLFCKVQSQLYGLGPIYPGPYVDPGPCGPYVDPYLQNISPAAQPCASPSFLPNIQSILNLPLSSLIQNQIPCNQPIINPVPCSQPLLNVPQLTPSIINPVQQCAPAAPVVATTVVDNTLANSLANAIQLLIVSNLIENTLGSTGGGCNLGQTLGFLDNPCVNNFEVLSTDYYPSANVISCEYPSPVIDRNPCFNEICYHQEPISFQAPCFEVSPCNPPCYSPSIPVVVDCNSFNSYNSLGFDSCVSNPVFTIETCSNPFGSQVVPFSRVEPAIATISPMAVEVPFPESIPAQLICNFGYLPPNNAPCVSFNVEPCNSCNMFGNCGNYF